jgi:hypothetical protein
MLLHANHPRMWVSSPARPTTNTLESARAAGLNRRKTFVSMLSARRLRAVHPHGNVRMVCPIHDVIQQKYPPEIAYGGGKKSSLLRTRRLSHFHHETIMRSGGARRDRTDDLLLAKQALSQLSYGPDFDSARQNWWAWEDLNFRPHAYQARALTS